jgi:O-antigen/teichoic acid export membrane protein
MSVIGQAFNGGISFLGISVWANIASQSDLASIFIPLAFIAIAIDLIDFGGNSWISREIIHSNLRSRTTWDYVLPKNIFLISILSVISIGMLLKEIEFLFIIFIFFYSIFILNMSYFQGFCIRTENYLEAFIAQFLERSSWLFPLFLIHIIKKPLDCIFLSLLIGSLASICYIFFKVANCLREDGNEHRTRFSLRQTYLSSFKLGLSSVISDLYAIDSFLVQTFAGSFQAGGYSLVQKNRNFAVLGFSVFGAKLRLAVSKSKKARKEIFQQEWQIIFINILMLITSFICTPNIIQYFYGSEYLSLKSVMRIGLLIFLCSGICILLQSYISGIRDDTFLSIFTGFNMIAVILAISIGAHLSGAVGASLGLLASYFVQIILLTIRIKSKSHNVLK